MHLLIVLTKALIIGGYANATYINDVYPIDLKTPSNNCQSLTDYPYNLDGLVATLYNGVLKACGGFAGYDFSDCYDYDFAQGVWLPAPFMQRTRSYSGASQIDGKWVVTGGGFPGTADTIEVWDGSSWSFGPIMPEEMMGHCRLALTCLPRRTYAARGSGKGRTNPPHRPALAAVEFGGVGGWMAPESTPGN